MKTGQMLVFYVEIVGFCISLSDTLLLQSSNIRFLNLSVEVNITSHNLLLSLVTANCYTNHSLIKGQVLLHSSIKEVYLQR